MSKILELVEKHEKMRSEGLNLIASENILSANVKKALTSDLAGRYHTDWYGGSKIAQDIIQKTEELACKLFKVKHAIVNPLSGNVCDLTALFTFTSPGDKVAIVPFTSGGYPFGIGKFHRERIYLPTNKQSYQIELEETKKFIEEKKPKLTILGASFLLFPQPVKEISGYVQELGDSYRCVYDGAHILGLLACGQFQDPIREGAEVLFGSTHKSLYGPQGGILLTNSNEHAEALRNLMEIDLDLGIGLVDNPHMNRVAALGVALEELLEDQDYGKRVIENSKALAKALDDLGVPVKFKDRGYTESHQILLDLDEERAHKLCDELEKVGIFIDIAGRIGTSESTHRGMGKADMGGIAHLISEVYKNGATKEIKEQVKGFVRSKL
jgi:glycine hydroxymethyltransferase